MTTFRQAILAAFWGLHVGPYPVRCPAVQRWNTCPLARTAEKIIPEIVGKTYAQMFAAKKIRSCAQ